MTGAAGPADDVDDPAGQHAGDVAETRRGQTAASTLDVVLAQTAGSSDAADLVGAVDDGGHDSPGAADDSDLTAGVVLVDDPIVWPGQLANGIGGVDTTSSNATAGGPAAGWQRVATGFLLGYAGASRAAYAADLRDYLTWWADTATPDYPADPSSSGAEASHSAGLPARWARGPGTATAPTR